MENQSTPQPDQTPVPAPAPAPQAMPQPVVAGSPAPSAAMTTWPGAFKAYGPSRAAVVLNLSTNVWIWVFSIIGSIVLSVLLSKLFLLNELASILLSSLITGAKVFAAVHGIRGKRVEIGETMQVGLKVCLKLFVLTLLLGLTAVVSFILLIVPFFFVFPRLTLAPYLLVDKNMGILEAYKTSWALTKGHMGKVYGIVGVTIVMCLPIITIIGILATIYLLFMYGAAVGLLYQYILDKQPAPAQ